MERHAKAIDANAATIPQTALVCPQCYGQHITELEGEPGELTGPTKTSLCRSCGWRGESAQLRRAGFRQKLDPIVEARYLRRAAGILSVVQANAAKAKETGMIQPMGVADPAMLGETREEMIETLWRMSISGVLPFFGRPVNEEAVDGSGAGGPVIVDGGGEK